VTTNAKAKQTRSTQLPKPVEAIATRKSNRTSKKNIENKEVKSNGGPVDMSDVNSDTLESGDQFEESEVNGNTLDVDEEEEITESEPLTREQLSLVEVKSLMH
jgi:hypothetical protein